MLRPVAPLTFAFALLTTLGSGTLGCGARSSLVEGTTGEEAGIYVADSQFTASGPGRIVRFSDMNGKGWTAATLSYDDALISPCGPAIGSNGAIYFADVAGARIFSMKDMTGADLTAFGPTGPDAGAFNTVTGLALDGDDRILVVSSGADRIVRLDDMTGAGLVEFGTSGAGQGQLSAPRGIAISSSGKILISDFGNHRLVQIDDMTGAGWAEWPVPGYLDEASSPYGVAYDAADRIYAIDFASPTIHRIDSIAGDNHFSYTDPALSQSSHVAIGPDGRIYITILNIGHGIARMDDWSGTGLVVYGGEGNGAGQFENPCGIVVK